MDPDDENLIPPTLSTSNAATLTSATKEDVDRAEYLMNMVKATLSGKYMLWANALILATEWIFFSSNGAKASREDLDDTNNYYLRVCEKYEQSAGEWSFQYYILRLLTTIQACCHQKLDASDARRI
ncbi:hypothetical protein V1515DRAFT_487776 [Lipomyces mesembrius]